MSAKNETLNDPLSYNIALRRIRKNGACLDSCVLLLFIAGLYDPKSIERYPALSAYSSGDYDNLIQILTLANRIFTTTYIAPEISNLIINRDEKGHFAKYQYEYATSMINYFTHKDIEMEHKRLKELMESDSVPSLGVTDTSILELTREKHVVVITDDYKLYKQVCGYGETAILTEEIKELLHILS